MPKFFLLLKNFMENSTNQMKEKLGLEKLHWISAQRALGFRGENGKVEKGLRLVILEEWGCSLRKIISFKREVVHAMVLSKSSGVHV